MSLKQRKIKFKPRMQLSLSFKVQPTSLIIPSSQRVATQALRSLSASSPSSLPTDTRAAAIDIGNNSGLTAITYLQENWKRQSH